MRGDGVRAGNFPRDGEKCPGVDEELDNDDVLALEEYVAATGRLVHVDPNVGGSATALE